MKISNDLDSLKKIAADQIEYLGGGHESLYLFARGSGFALNPALWGIGPYERTERIVIDLGRDEIEHVCKACTLIRHSPDTYDESIEWRTSRVTHFYRMNGYVSREALMEIYRPQEIEIRNSQEFQIGIGGDIPAFYRQTNCGIYL